MRDDIKKRPFLINLDMDMIEAARRLGDSVSREQEPAFVEAILSLLFCTLIYKGTEETTDGFERVLKQVDCSGEPDNSAIWGEFMALQFYFFKQYKYDTLITEELERLASGDYRVHPEETFTVKYSRNAAYVRVG